MDEARSLAGMEKSHPVDFALFGTLGAVSAHLGETVISGFNGRRFEFMDITEFGSLVRSGPLAEVNRVYWKEILYRAFWASAINLMRHQRWQMACDRAFEAPANALAFAAALRGLLEGAQDAWFSLRAVLPTLARDWALIESAISGNMRDKELVGPELEDCLIHFIYARKVAKGAEDTSPDSHKALDPRDYRDAIGLPGEEREAWRQLYDRLCAMCHPTAFSMTADWTDTGGTVQINRSDDTLQILDLCREYRAVITCALSLSVTQSAMVLKILNRFSLPEIKCAEIEHWNFEDIPGWRKASATLTKQLVH